MSRLYHGTARALGLVIEREGLSPAGCDAVGEPYRKSCYSAPGYVYFTDSLESAELFACGTAKKVGIGFMGQIFAVDFEEGEVESDPLLPSGSWRFRGSIPPERLESVRIVDCRRSKFV